MRKPPRRSDREGSGVALDGGVAGGLLKLRLPLLLVLIALSLTAAWNAKELTSDPAFAKLLPADHPYVHAYLEHRHEFGGADRIRVALHQSAGGSADLFNPTFLTTLERVTERLIQLPGVDPGRVRSLFTPNVRYLEVTAAGLVSGDLLPADFQPDAAGIAELRANVLKSTEIGRLVASDFSGAIVEVELIPGQQPLDYLLLTGEIERLAEELPDSIELRVVGFARLVGEIHAAARSVLLFAAIALTLVALLLLLHFRSLLLAAIPLLAAATAVLWTLGLLPLLGIGLDPFSILLPFLLFALAVGHAVQLVTGLRGESERSPRAAAARLLERLFPAAVAALTSDALGFALLFWIDVPLIREMALLSCIGIGAVAIANLLLIPILISYLPPSALGSGPAPWSLWMGPIGARLWPLTRRRPAAIALGGAALLLVVAYLPASQVRIGALGSGAPELAADSRYNRDLAEVAALYPHTAPRLTAILQGAPDACVDYPIMAAIDALGWQMQGMTEVRAVITLPHLAQPLLVAWNEGQPKWYGLSRNPHLLAEAIRPFEGAQGLVDRDCARIALHLLTHDRSAETIDRLIDTLERWAASPENPGLELIIGTGELALQAAANDRVRQAQLPSLMAIFIVVYLVAALTLRSLRLPLAILLPLLIAKVATFALMALLGIGLRVNTLPVAILGVGVGVDYGIYLLTRVRAAMARGATLGDAYASALRDTGAAVWITGIALTLAVGSWAFSSLKLQADLGLLLAFMFVINMLGALIWIPASVAWLSRADSVPPSPRG